MTNSSRETDIRNSGTEPVESPPKSGAQAPHAELSGAAGDATHVAPRQFTTAEVFEALAAAVAEFESAGKIATAAGVSARMRKLRPGFSVASTEFASFRDLTQAAVANGIITSTRTPSDFVLKLVRDDDFRGATLHPDLWRAIQDWTDGVQYAFNRATRRTEPTGTMLPAGAVAVPSVDKSTTLQWMRDFADAQQGDPALQLETVLQEDDPVAAFLRITRGNDSLKRRWSKYLRLRVIETAVNWAMVNGIPRDDIFASLAPLQESPARRPDGGAMRGEDVDARRRVLDILQSMPLHELLRLPIPLEYALKR